MPQKYDINGNKITQHYDVDGNLVDDNEPVGPSASMNTHAKIQPHHTSYIDVLVDKYGSKVKDIWNNINKPLVDIPDTSPEMMKASPVFGKIGQVAGDLLESATTPLSVGLGATGLLARIPGLIGEGASMANKAVGAGMIGHGAYNVYEQPTLGGKLQGGLEAGIGALGYKYSGNPKLKIGGELPIEKPVMPPEFVKPGAELEFNAKIPKPIIPDPAENSFQQVATNKGITVRPPELIDHMIESLQGSDHPEAQSLLKKLQAKKIAMTVVQESALPQVASPVEKLINALEDAKPLSEEQKVSYAGQRSERLAEMNKVKTPGLSGHYERIGKLAGEYDKVEMTPIQLDAQDVDHLVDAIQNNGNLKEFQKINATTGLTRMLNGQLPRDYERELLKNVFGETFAGTIDSKLPLIDQRRSLVAELVNLPRALQASMDFSAPLRQGLPLIARKEYWNSFADMFKSFGSETAFKGVQESIQANPHFELGQESGLKLTDLVNAREEQMMSTIAEKVPGVRPSNRAYTAFINKLRQDTFSSLINDAERTGLDPKNNLHLTSEIADFVNTSTGRGSLGNLEKSAQTLNNVFFSPRLIASRVKMLNPNYYIKASPMVRKEAIKSLLSVAGAGGTFTGLGKMTGAEVGLDPTSADFGKMKFGDVRLDPYGGFQQYVVAASRLLSGESTSSETGRTTDLTKGQFGRPTRADIIQRFGESKLNPPLSFALSLLRGKDYAGIPINPTAETIKLFTPMMIQDLYQIASEDPKFLPLMVPNTFGMGLQKYGSH